MHGELELGGIIIFVATQLITFGMLRQQVKDIGDRVDGEIIDRKLLEDRVRALEVKAAQVNQFSFAEKQGV